MPITGPQPPERSPNLALILSGPLPCIGCGYDLSGLSITARCPECGIDVRATLVTAVDPEGATLEPLTSPRLTAYGLVGLAICTTAAAATIWTQRGADLLCVLQGHRCIWPGTGVIAGGMVSAGAVCSLVLVRPVRGTRVHSAVRSALGSACLLAAGWRIYRLHATADPIRLPPYIDLHRVPTDRVIERLIIGALLAAGVLLLRRTARALSTRSFLLRRDHDNRQRLLALAAAIGLAMIGDGVLLLSTHAPGTGESVLRIAGYVTVVAASVILTAGLVAALIDTLRIARSLARPVRRYRDLTRKEIQAVDRSDG
ncbi:MAG: hypothetical protein ACTS22_04715 [Phycisphaerales bacterium]